MFVERVRRRAAMAGVLTIALVLTSCGAVEDALGGDEEAETLGVAETTEQTEETVEATTTTAPVFDAETYCALSHEADVINAEFVAFDDPVLLEGFITSLTGLLNEAVPPPTIADEFIRFRTAYVDLQAQLEAGGYAIEVLQASPILSDANVNAAITVVDAHDLEVCGVAPGLEAAGEEPVEPDSSGIPSDNPFAEALTTGDFSAIEELLATEVGRNAFIEGFIGNADGVTPEQGACFLDNADIAVLAEMSVDPSNLSDESVAEFLSALEACDIPLSAFQNAGS